MGLSPIALAAEQLDLHYGGRPVLHQVSVAFRRGAVTALCGPNGSGKSSLLRALCGLAPVTGGRVLVNDHPTADLPPRDLARRLAILPQTPEVPAGITVRELVGFGRHPHLGLLRRPGPEDRQAVDWALEKTLLHPLADRPVALLSGGERQRAWIAMTLAQRTGILLLDEPTTYLDIRHQHDVLTLIRRLNREEGLTVIWVLHDLNQAAAYSDALVLLRDGTVVADGPPESVLSPECLKQVFDLDVVLARHPLSGALLCLPADLPGAAG